MQGTEGRMLTEYEHEQMMNYGPCAICGGPRTTFTTVRGRPGDGFEVEMGTRCLWCGD